MSYNEELQSNNGELEEILRQVNALPNANPEVTAETIVSALGYTPANQEDVSTLSEQKANKQGLSLGVGEDGLVYLFVDGAAQGNGLDIKAEVVSGDVIGYVDGDNNIILTGALADGTYVLKYEDTEGNLTEIGSIEVGCSAYTNKIPLSINSDGSLYNGGQGWKADARINSSGEEVAQVGLACTGFIPVKLNDVIYMRDVGFYNNDSSAPKTYHIAVYDSTFKFLSKRDMYSVNNPVGAVVDSNGCLIEFRISKSMFGDVDIPTVAYLRVSAREITDESIITVNEEITD